jgi:hypothetical protein
MYNKGDIVVCINNDNGKLEHVKVGTKYSVIFMEEEYGIWIVDDSKYSGLYHVDSFKLARNIKIENILNSL